MAYTFKVAGRGTALTERLEVASDADAVIQAAMLAADVLRHPSPGVESDLIVEVLASAGQLCAKLVVKPNSRSRGRSTDDEFQHDGEGHPS